MTAPHDGIVVEHLARRFGGVQAVRDATFDVAPGTVTGLVGPNGAGKTTLMLMLASLLAPDSGSIRIGGYDPVTDPAAVRRAMGWMPDVLGSWPTLTVRATLEVTARLYGIEQAQAKARATELIGLVDLGPLADQPTRVLSRGQKQRLSLGRALVHDPGVLLLDEPASGLDPAARVALRELVRRLASDGRAVLVSSHVLAELEEMVDDAVFLEAGATASAERVEAARSAQREWRVRGLDDAALLAALERLGVPVARADAAGAVVLLTGDAEAAGLVQRLVAEGVAVHTVAPAVGDLERTFLGLAGGAA